MTIHKELWENKRHQLVIYTSFIQRANSRDEYEDHPKAIRVPALLKPFLLLPDFGTYKLRLATTLYRATGVALLSHPIIVKLPSTVVTIANAVFQGCYALTTVAMPGCLFLGARLFAECCALERVGVLTENSCRLARGATISPYAFEECGKLRQIGLPGTKANIDVLSATPPPEGLPAGIQRIDIIRSTEFIGHKAFAQCQQLTAIDLSRTQVSILSMQVFSHCRALTQVILPWCLTEIRAEAFEACVLLYTVALPRQLLSIGHRAFAGCSKLVCLTYRGAEADRRRLQVAANAFEGCQALVVPEGICYLSVRGRQRTQKYAIWESQEEDFARPT